jgi:hypothetical protein
MSKEIADKFRTMADRIEKNADEPFGGCVMIFPPGENVEPVELLWLDAKTDHTSFWGTIKAKCDIAVAELGNQTRMGQAFRR